MSTEKCCWTYGSETRKATEWPGVLIVLVDHGEVNFPLVRWVSQFLRLPELLSFRIPGGCLN